MDQMHTKSHTQTHQAANTYTSEELHYHLQGARLRCRNKKQHRRLRPRIPKKGRQSYKMVKGYPTSQKNPTEFRVLQRTNTAEPEAMQLLQQRKHSSWSDQGPTLQPQRRGILR